MKLKGINQSIVSKNVNNGITSEPDLGLLKQVRMSNLW